ncbi:MAG: hydrogenase nickel incorporation protein HypB [Candidatus Aminicenantales bacterium]
MRTLVLGLGNDLYGDDGTGLHVVRKLREEYESVRERPAWMGHVEFLESSLSGIKLLDLITGYDVLLIIDTIKKQNPKPGRIHLLDGRGLRHIPGPSPHYISIPQTLEIGKALGFKVPAEVRVIAIEAKNIYHLGEGLSQKMLKCLPRIIKKTKEILEEIYHEMKEQKLRKKEFVVLEDLLGSNLKIASEIRQKLETRKILTINFLSSPGAGKTTLLEKIAEHLSGRYRMAVIEGDIETERDAERIRAKGIPAWQITTGGACHLEAKMIAKIFPQIPEGLNFLFIENVGNLVCPASFDLGERLRCVLLSAPEGDDKPKKYPKAFATSDCLILTKSDLHSLLPFDAERARKEALEVNPRLKIFSTSALTGDGVKELVDFFISALQNLSHA